MENGSEAEAPGQGVSGLGASGQGGSGRGVDDKEGGERIEFDGGYDGRDRDVD